jgi:Arc/MetJ-type ribon-helix-helix transcriptional regulator
MASSIRSLPKKKRGRPATGRDPVSAIRLSPDLIATIDKWAARNDVSSRSEAIRRLVEVGLGEAPPVQRRSRKATSKASDMAARQIDKIGDPSATDEERQQRKRRLLKGPREFRDIRGNLPRPKG